MMSNLRKHTVLFLTALLCSPIASAQSPVPSRLDAIRARGTLRVGATFDYPPYSFVDRKTSADAGFDVDMMSALARSLGVKVEFVRTSWPTMARDFEAGAFDLAAGGVSVTAEREKLGPFSSVLMQDGKTPIARCADREKFATLAEIDRPGVRVIVNPGGSNERFARAHVHAAEITVHPDNTTIFDQIADGRADVMMTDASETRFQQKQHPGVLCAVHPDQPFEVTQKAYWLQRDDALKAAVDGWLARAKEDGTFQAIAERWFR